MEGIEVETDKYCDNSGIGHHRSRFPLRDLGVDGSVFLRSQSLILYWSLSVTMITHFYNGKKIFRALFNNYYGGVYKSQWEKETESAGKAGSGYNKGR